MNPSPVAADTRQDPTPGQGAAAHDDTSPATTDATDASVTTSGEIGGASDGPSGVSVGADTAAAPAAIDLGAIDADLDGVETALRRLDDGTYWNDEITGEPIDPDALAADPTRRRA